MFKLIKYIQYNQETSNYINKMKVIAALKKNVHICGFLPIMMQ